MLDYIKVGKIFYNTKRSRGMKRLIVFVARCLCHNQQMERLHLFFTRDALLAQVAEKNPFVYEQPTRAFFYNKSTFAERAKLVEQHMDYLAKHLKEDVLIGLYSETPYILWESHDEAGHLRFELTYRPGQRKEGLLSVVLRLDDADLYQMMFWIAPNKAG